MKKIQFYDVINLKYILSCITRFFFLKSKIFVLKMTFLPASLTYFLSLWLFCSNFYTKNDLKLNTLYGEIFLVEIRVGKVNSINFHLHQSIYFSSVIFSTYLSDSNHFFLAPHYIYIYICVYFWSKLLFKQVCLKTMRLVFLWS